MAEVIEKRASGRERERGTTLRAGGYRCERLTHPKDWQIRIAGWDVQGHDVESAGVSSCTIVRYHDDGTVYDEPISCISIIAFWLLIAGCAFALAYATQAGAIPQ